MNTLHIRIPRKYKLFRFLFGYYRTIINRKAPDKWEEVSKKQLQKLVTIFFLQEMTDDERKLKAAMVLYKLKTFHLFLFEADQMHAIVTKCDWLYEKPLTAQLLPKLANLHGPGDKLAGYTGYEFIYADTYFMNYAESKDLKWLDKMIPVLYRPKRKKQAENGDWRIPFVPFAAKLREKKMAKLPIWMKYAIFMYYKGCREEWEQMHTNLFNQESQSNAKAEGWHQVLIRISGKEFGTYNETVAEPIHTLFSKMDLDVKDYNQQKRNNPNS